jgi:hypothetical protein
MKIKVLNKELIKKKKNLRRIMITGTLVVSISLASFLGLVGCTKKDSTTIKGSTYTTTQSPNVSVSSTDPTLLMEEDDYKEVTRSNTEVTLDDDKLSQFQEYLNTIEPDYPCSDLFQIEEALYSKSTYTETTSHYKDIRNSDGSISVDRLVSTIKENNVSYYDELGAMKAFYKEMDDSEIRSVCEVIVDVINSMKTDESIDMDRVSCYLADLKMYYKSGSAMAAVSREGVMSINPNMIKVGSVIGGKDETSDVLTHEIMHIIQSDCLEHDTKFEVGVGYKDMDLSINPLYYSWLIEASAEKEMAKLTGNETLTYEYQIGYMESLALALTLDTDYEVGEIEDINLYKDQDKLFEMFKLPQDEVMKMLYSLEIIEAEPQEFKDAYKNAYGEELSSDRLVEIKRDMKSSICTTLSKVFYRDLANRVNDGNVTLEDAFYLIKVFQSDLFTHLRYDNEAKLEHSMYYLETYTEIQKNFFSSLSVSGMTYEDIAAYFDEYSMRVIKDGVEIDKNYTLSFLPESKIEYIENRKSDVYTKNALDPLKTWENCQRS